VFAVSEDTSSENQMFGECNCTSNKGQQNLHKKINWILSYALEIFAPKVCELFCKWPWLLNISSALCKRPPPTPQVSPERRQRHIHQIELRGQLDYYSAIWRQKQNWQKLSRPQTAKEGPVSRLGRAHQSRRQNSSSSSSWYVQWFSP